MMTPAIMQAIIEAMKAAAQAMLEAAGAIRRDNVAVTTPSMNTRSSGPALK